MSLLSKSLRTINHWMTSKATPTLDRFSVDLTDAAVNGSLPIFIGRENEIEEIFRVIKGKRESVVLVGPVGVGKNALLSHLAILMVKNQVPDELKQKRLLCLSVEHLIVSDSESIVREQFLLMIAWELARYLLTQILLSKK